MAAASYPPPLTPPWIPEDDLLLKNSVEAGASLEALAKGAVRFSRKFTLRELRQRWHSLLYDPVVSAEASARMFEFEVSSNLNKPSSKGSGGVGGGGGGGESRLKRKVETVRQLYYAMRKKTRRQIHGDSPSLALDYKPTWFFGEQGGTSFGFVGKEVERRSDGAGVANGKQLGLPAMDAFHSGETLGGGGERQAVGEMNCLTAVQDCDFTDISDAILNFGNEDDMFFVDGGGGDAFGDSCYASVNSLLATSPSNVVRDDAPDVGESRALALDTSIVTSADACPPLEFENVAEGLASGDQHNHCSSEKDAGVSVSLLAPNTCSPQQKDGDMACVLNTEDTEIPCNDDILFFRGEVIRATSKEPRYGSSSYANGKGGKQELRSRSIKKVQESESQMVGLDMLVTSPRSYPCASYGVKFGPLDVKPPVPISRRTDTVHGDPGKCRSNNAIPTSAAAGLLKAEPLQACNASDLVLRGKASARIEAIPASIVDHESLYQEESESDDDVPSFKDIEAMILGMDLCPEEPDSFINSRVSRYQNEEAKRTIIRLEQCALSSMQRAIASRGAFAVLYGRHMKHYIKETEVSLGRATDDMDVDIDLRREGPANKISRQQALIKMEADGFFILKNIGKSPMFLNGKEVATGQSMKLGSSSLIEIRGMAFVFEMNVKCVRQYLANVAKSHQGNNTEFHWSEERLPTPKRIHRGSIGNGKHDGPACLTDKDYAKYGCILTHSR